MRDYCDDISEDKMGAVNGETNLAIEDFVQARNDVAWLGKVNLYTMEETGDLHPYSPDEDLLNFSCDFILPVYDVELERLIKERKNIPYTTAMDDYRRITRIFSRVKALGGIILHWA